MPVLPAAHVTRAAEFWRDRLGFAIAGLWCADGGDGSEGFAIVGRDTITVGLDSGSAPTADRHGWSAYLYIDDVRAYCDEIRGHGATIAREPEEAFYGCIDFDVRDLDGNLIAFGQDLRPGPDGPGL